MTSDTDTKKKEEPKKGRTKRYIPNLAEFYFEKLRYDDASSVYKSFIDLNPYHAAAPHFGMRIVDIYDAAGFPLLVVESKKEFATRYAVDSDAMYSPSSASSGMICFGDRLRCLFEVSAWSSR